jgi:hypothetical protein
MKIFGVLIVLVWVGCRVLFAVDTPEEAAKKAYLANINALMVFTSKDGLNSGRYEFTRANTTMKILHLPFRYQFDPFKPGWNFFLIGGIGYSETVMTTDVNTTASAAGDITLTTKNMLQTFTGGIGGGIRYRNDSGIEVLGGLEPIYSWVGVTNRNDNGAGQIVEDFFKGQYNENLSYKFFVIGEYHRDFDGFKPYVTLSYELYETKSAISIQELSKFTTQTNVTSFSVGAETPPLLYAGSNYLSLEGYLRGSYLGGDITKVAGFDGFGTLGGIAYWYVPETLNYIRRFYVEVSTIQADGLRGYNIGLGFSLDY